MVFHEIRGAARLVFGDDFMSAGRFSQVWNGLIGAAAAFRLAPAKTTARLLSVPMLSKELKFDVIVPSRRVITERDFAPPQPCEDYVRSISKAEAMNTLKTDDTVHLPVAADLTARRFELTDQDTGGAKKFVRRPFLKPRCLQRGMGLAGTASGTYSSSASQFSVTHVTDPACGGRAADVALTGAAGVARVIMEEYVGALPPGSCIRPRVSIASSTPVTVKAIDRADAIKSKTSYLMQACRRMLDPSGFVQMEQRVETGADSSAALAEIYEETLYGGEEIEQDADMVGMMMGLMMYGTNTSGGSEIKIERARNVLKSAQENGENDAPKTSGLAKTVIKTARRLAREVGSGNARLRGELLSQRLNDQIFAEMRSST